MRRLEEDASRCLIGMAANNAGIPSAIERGELATRLADQLPVEGSDAVAFCSRWHLKADAFDLLLGEPNRVNTCQELMNVRGGTSQGVPVLLMDTNLLAVDDLLQQELVQRLSTEQVCRRRITTSFTENSRDTRISQAFPKIKQGFIMCFLRFLIPGSQLLLMMNFVSKSHIRKREPPSCKPSLNPKTPNYSRLRDLEYTLHPKQKP